jgi:hypothetical protein
MNSLSHDSNQRFYDVDDDQNEFVRGAKTKAKATADNATALAITNHERTGDCLPSIS